MLGNFWLSRSIIYPVFSLLENAPFYLGCQRGTRGFWQGGKVWLTQVLAPSARWIYKSDVIYLHFYIAAWSEMQRYERLVFIWRSDCQIKWWQMEKLNATVSGVRWQPSALSRGKYINLSWCLQKIRVQFKGSPRTFYLINTPYRREQRTALELKQCY